MKFSIIYEAQMVDTSRANEARCFHEIIEQSLLAEEMGKGAFAGVLHCFTSGERLARAAVEMGRI